MLSRCLWLHQTVQSVQVWLLSAGLIWMNLNETKTHKHNILEQTTSATCSLVAMGLISLATALQIFISFQCGGWFQSSFCHSDLVDRRSPNLCKNTWHCVHCFRSTTVYPGTVTSQKNCTWRPDHWGAQLLPWSAQTLPQRTSRQLLRVQLFRTSRWALLGAPKRMPITGSTVLWNILIMVLSCTPWLPQRLPLPSLWRSSEGCVVLLLHLSEHKSRHCPPYLLKQNIYLQYIPFPFFLSISFFFRPFSCFLPVFISFYVPFLTCVTW